MSALYIIKVNVCLALVWAFCRLVLGRDTRFGWKRTCINAGIVLSLLLPALPPLSYSVNLPDVLSGARVLPVIEVTPGDEAAEGVWNAMTILWWIYAAVSSLLALRLLTMLARIRRLKDECVAEDYDGVTLYRYDGEGNGIFSFFSFIFVPRQASPKGFVISHEREHCRRLHSCDVLAGELLCILFWYNPIAWVLRREIRDNLEFLADRAAIDGDVDAREYQYELVGAATGTPVSRFCTNFNVSSLKRRILMINRFSPCKSGALLYLLALPVVGVMMFAACTSSTVREKHGQEADAEVAAAVEAAPVVEEPAEPAEVKTDTGNAAAKAGSRRSSVDAAALVWWVNSKINFPHEAIDGQIQGKVVARVTLDDDGNVADVKIVESAHKILDDEVLRVAKMLPKQNPPATEDDRNIEIPIAFKMETMEYPVKD